MCRKKDLNNYFNSGSLKNMLILPKKYVDIAYHRQSFDQKCLYKLLSYYLH